MYYIYIYISWPRSREPPISPKHRAKARVGGSHDAYQNIKIDIIHRRELALAWGAVVTSRGGGNVLTGPHVGGNVTDGGGNAPTAVVMPERRW